VKVKKWAKNGEMVQNCYPLSPLTNFLCFTTVSIFVATCVSFTSGAAKRVVTSEWEKIAEAFPARIKTPKEYVSQLPVISPSLISP
jgi:hypothetical protein